MINFRFHVISLVAVFLALALGIVIGSTTVDDGIIRQLRREIRDAEDRSNAVEAEYDRMRAEIDALESFVDDTGGFVAEDRLNGRPAAVLALRGADEGVVEEAADRLREAGAVLPGVVWLESDWSLDGDRAERLAAAMGVPATVRPEVLRLRALRRLAERLGRAPGDATTGTTTGEGRVEAESDYLVALVEAGFVEVASADGDDPLGDFPSRRPVVLVVGSRGEAGVSGLLAAATAAVAAEGLPVVAGEVNQDGAERGELLSPLREDDVLAESVSTVDDLDQARGRVVAVLALEAAAAGRVGHYGYGAGAQGATPEWPGR